MGGQGFLYWGIGEWPTTSQNSAQSSQQEKFTPVDSTPTKFLFIPPTK